MNLTAYDFFGNLTWTGGTDKERCERLHAFEELGLEPEEIMAVHGKLIEEKCPNCGVKMDGWRGIANQEKEDNKKK